MRPGKVPGSFYGIIRTLLLLLCLNLCTLAATGAAPNASVDVDNEVVARQVCKKDQEVREMEILPTKKGCTLQYTKGGKTEEKAKSIRTVEVCKEAMKKIADRLIAAGYHCE